MSWYKRAVEFGHGLWVAGAALLVMAGIPTLIVLWLDFREAAPGEPVTTGHHHHHHVVQHFHWAGGQLILWLLALDVIALIMIRVGLGTLRRSVEYGFDVANVRAITDWTHREAERYAKTYRRSKRGRK
jgi:hypothetical protein